MAEGILDFQNIQFPPGIDPARILGFQNRSGVDFGELLRIIDSRLSAAGELVDPLVASISKTTTAQTTTGANPLAFAVTERSEYARDRGQRTTLDAYMLPIRDWENGLHMTSMALETMPLEQILLQVDSSILGHRRQERLRCLQRLFAVETWTFGRQVTGLSPGFAGSGAGNLAFNRPYPDGTAVTLPYTLYSRTAVNTMAATVAARMAELDRWNGFGVYDLIGGTNAIAAIAADATNFVPAGQLLVQPGSAANVAQVDNTQYIGVYMGRIRVRNAATEVADAAADFRLALVRSYGDNDPRNPLAYRYDPTRPNPWIDMTNVYPLADAQMYKRYDFGVDDLTGAGLMRFAAAGNYTTPVIA